MAPAPPHASLDGTIVATAMPTIIGDSFDEEGGETELEAQPQRAEAEMAPPGA